MTPATKHKVRDEQRASPIRRQFNEAFYTPDGQFSPTKFVAFAGQVVLLYHLGLDFDQLLERWDALLLTAGLVIMPDTIKMVIRLKFGGASVPNKPA